MVSTIPGSTIVSTYHYLLCTTHWVWITHTHKQVSEWKVPKSCRVGLPSMKILKPDSPCPCYWYRPADHCHCGGHESRKRWRLKRRTPPWPLTLGVEGRNVDYPHMNLTLLWLWALVKNWKIRYIWLDQNKYNHQCQASGSGPSIPLCLSM